MNLLLIICYPVRLFISMNNPLPPPNNQADTQELPSSRSQTPPPLNYSKPKPFWLYLPWALLSFVLAGVLWLTTQGKMPLVSKQTLATPNTTSEWQPPKANPVPAQTAPLATPTGKQETVTSYHNAVATAAQSVVNIYTTQKVTSHPYLNDPILRKFYEYHGVLPQDNSDNTSLGSGVIVSKDGYIITNAHVINQADSIVVGLTDGRKATAKVIGTDPESDLAVIKVDLTGLTPLGFRETPTQVGDVVLAIGNPFGVGQTVTQGIISATDRTGLGINTFENFIQTDAAINPGNSGGALVDAYGQLVGINTAIFSRSGGSMGIGFAIPTSSVEQVMSSIIKTGKVSRGWLGVEVEGRMADPTKLAEDKLGVTVMNVIPDSPAAKAGIQRGDVILALDDQPMNNANSLIQYIARKSPNSVLNAQVKRGDTQQKVPITLAERQSLSTLQKMEEQQQRQNGGQNNRQYRNQQIPQELLDLMNR